MGRMTMPCVDGGRVHAWKRTSYGGRKSCVWCGKVKYRWIRRAPYTRHIIFYDRWRVPYAPPYGWQRRR